MKRMKRGLGVLLAGTMLAGALSGCESKPAADDVTYQLTGIARDAILLKVNGEPVTAEEYFFQLGQDISYMQQLGRPLRRGPLGAGTGGGQDPGCLCEGGCPPAGQVL